MKTVTCCCNVCRKAIAVSIIRDHACKTYVACKGCTKTLKDMADYCNTRLDVNPIK